MILALQIDSGSYKRQKSYEKNIESLILSLYSYIVLFQI